MHDVLRKIGEFRVIPILVGVEDLSVVLPICDALSEGGLPLLEITLRTELATEALRLAAAERPGMLLGAGTVITIEQAQRAANAGAHFLVSPGLDSALVAFSHQVGLPITPGVCTPTETQAALGLGLEVVKFFPATTMGGPETLKFLAGPYPTIKFVATGGIGPSNMDDYLALPNLLACGGTWMFVSGPDGGLDCRGITQRARDSVAVAARYR